MDKTGEAEVVSRAPLDAGSAKIRLSNLPRSSNIPSIRRLVSSILGISLEAVSCRKAPKWDFAVLGIRSATVTLSLALQRLDGVEWKRRRLAAAAMADDATDGDDGRGDKGEPIILKTLNDQVTPLWKMAYPEQLEFKKGEVGKVLDSYKKKCDFRGDFEGIKASPKINGYRNKCEFTIGFDQNRRPTVGFSLGSFRDGIISVHNAAECPHIPDVAKEIANRLQAYVLRSGLPTYDRDTKTGFWRLMLFRVHDERVMLMLQVQDRTLAEKEYAEAVKSLQEFFRAFEWIDEETGTIYHVDSLYLQATTALHHGIDPKAKMELIAGEPFLTETLLGLRFQISPASFFQVNPAATAVLYQTIRDYVVDSPQDKTVLLDLCCGTGTIGMTMASSQAQVVGIETVPEAVEDARQNAARNGLDNMEFYAARVEDVINRVIEQVDPERSIVVVLDPPRSGVNSSVIKTIRSCPRISRVVYVACSPSSALSNFIDLGRKTDGMQASRPFALQKAVAIDMFPHTEHCELVLQFQRESGS